MTATLILLNLLVYAAEVYGRLSGLSRAGLARRFAVVPADIGHGHVGPLLLHVFAHASAAHLLGNLVVLLLFGRIVERHLGPARTLVAYLGSALVSTAISLGAQVALGQSVPTLGASGAVAGLVALGILFEPLVFVQRLVPVPVLLLGWLAMGTDLSGVLSGRRDGIDHFAHLGGYLSVLLAYPLLDLQERQRARWGLWLNVLTAIALGLCWWVWRDGVRHGA